MNKPSGSKKDVISFRLLNGSGEDDKHDLEGIDATQIQKPQVGNVAEEVRDLLKLTAPIFLSMVSWVALKTTGRWADLHGRWSELEVASSWRGRRLTSLWISLAQTLHYWATAARRSCLHPP